MKKKGKGRFYRVYTIEKSLRHHVIEWLGTLMGIIGSVFNARLGITGFYFFILGNIFFSMFAIKHRHYGLLTLQVVYFFFNIYGIIFWEKTL